MFVLLMSVIFFFFFKQKTADEMRISDWSSDVCSSDLICEKLNELRGQIAGSPVAHDRIRKKYKTKNTVGYSVNAFIDHQDPLDILEIGRASCRDRVCPYE